MSAKFLNISVNVPLVLVLSIIPDVDIIFQEVFPFIRHRGATHSIIFAFLIFIPFFALYHKKAIPYFLAFLSHFLIADYIIGGRIQLFWPLTFQHYGFEISIRSLTNVMLEWMLLLVAIFIMFRANDIATFFKPSKSNLLLIIPLPTLLLPVLLTLPVPPFLGLTLDIPVMLILPHLILAFLLLAAIFTGLLDFFKKCACMLT